MPKALLWLTIPTFSLALWGCDVEQTEEGKMPDVDVEAEGGQMPAYDVDTADVDIGTEKKTMEVPEVDVGTQEKQVTVPDINVQMPSENEPGGTRPGADMGVSGDDQPSSTQ